MKYPFGHKFSDSNKLFWVADTHINHRNYCRGVSSWSNTDRCLPFDDLEEMNAAIINSINERVNHDDHLFIIGDFSLGKASEIPKHRERINCQNIHLILGNHCKVIRKSPELQSLFSSVQDYLEIYVHDPSGNKQINMFHYPMKSWNNSHKLSWALTGHVHGSLPYENYELGLDCGWNLHMKPLSYKEINHIMKQKKWKPVCHHDIDTESP